MSSWGLEQRPWNAGEVAIDGFDNKSGSLSINHWQQQQQVSALSVNSRRPSHTASRGRNDSSSTFTVFRRFAADGCRIARRPSEHCDCSFVILATFPQVQFHWWRLDSEIFSFGTFLERWSIKRWLPFGRSEVMRKSWNVISSADDCN